MNLEREIAELQEAVSRRDGHIRTLEDELRKWQDEIGHLEAEIDMIENSNRRLRDLLFKVVVALEYMGTIRSNAVLTDHQKMRSVTEIAAVWERTLKQGINGEEFTRD